MSGSLLAVAAAIAFLLTGCQSNARSNSAETEDLKQQIARLEQQISALEQQQAAENDNAGSVERAEQAATVTTPEEMPVSVESSVPSEPEMSMDSQQTPSTSETPTDSEQAPSDANTVGSTSVQAQPTTSIDELTTHTMDELSDLVDAFVTKASAATPGGTVSEDLEQFFALKQEEKQIDDMLDRHEDELESLYRKNTLTREMYKQLERELEHLEDRLDDMEDHLEYVFGIDD